MCHDIQLCSDQIEIIRYNKSSASSYSRCFSVLLVLARPCASYLISSSGRTPVRKLWIFPCSRVVDVPNVVGPGRSRSRVLSPHNEKTTYDTTALKTVFLTRRSERRTSKFIRLTLEPKPPTPLVLVHQTPTPPGVQTTNRWWSKRPHTTLRSCVVPPCSSSTGPCSSSTGPCRPALALALFRWTHRTRCKNDN